MADGFEAIRPLGLEDAGRVLWDMPLHKYPRLSKVLPPMTPSDITIHWAGAAGHDLLQKSVSFVRSCAANYTEITGHSLVGKRIIDFGCGYGRFLRLFSMYSDDVYGVDAWEVSLEHSRAAGFGDRIALSAAVPSELVFVGFDFLFAFSIFTHLSETATISALKALRKSAVDGAVLAITTRPVEFWETAAQHGTHLKADQVPVSKLVADHQSSGFAFYVEGMEDTEGQHYGDTSLSTDWLREHAIGWRIEKFDRSLNDPMQRYVFLRAV